MSENNLRKNKQRKVTKKIIILWKLMNKIRIKKSKKVMKSLNTILTMLAINEEMTDGLPKKKLKLMKN